MVIGKDIVVSLRYVMRNQDGVILENTMEGMPATYIQGSSGILPMLQQPLEGLKAGDRKKLSLPNSVTGSGDLYFEVIIDHLRESLPEELMLGYPVLLNEKKCEEDCDCYTQDSKKITLS